VAENRDYEAIGKYRRAVELDPQFAEAYDAWGKTLQLLDRQKEAGEKFAKARELLDSKQKHH
jgi:tetratricopeptide (TPR) repeat protein